MPGHRRPVDISKLFYWLDLTGSPEGLDPLASAPAGRIAVQVDKSDNKVTVTSCGGWLRILLDERLVVCGPGLQFGTSAAVTIR